MLKENVTPVIHVLKIELDREVKLGFIAKQDQATYWVNSLVITEKKNGHTGSKRHSIHAVELSQWYGKPYANCAYLSRSQQWGPDYRFWASQSCGPGGWMVLLLIKKREISRRIQVRQIHASKSEFAISATDSYRLGSRYR